MATPIFRTFGEIDLTFIGGDTMSLAWWDKGSGGKHDGAYYNPDYTKLGSDYAGFYFLGSFGMNSFSNPAGPMLLVRVTAGNTAVKPALKLADDFTLIWKDSGSGADQNGSFWLPTSQDPDYKAVGTLCVRHHDKPDPATARVALVRSDLLERGTIGAFIWDDTGTGSDQDFGSWEISISSVFADSTNMLVAPGCFVGVASHTKPSSATAANVLKLPVLATHEDTPFIPRLTSPVQPPQLTAAEIVDTVTLPFTAVVDKGLTLEQQLSESPFYTLTREEMYELAHFYINGSEVTQQQTVTEATGVSTTDSSTFSASTGISVTAESGVSFLGSGGKVSATVSVELGYQTSTSVTQFVTKTISQQFQVAPQTALAVWTQFDQLTLSRMSGQPVSRSLEFRDDGDFVVSSMPLA